MSVAQKRSGSSYLNTIEREVQIFLFDFLPDLAAEIEDRPESGFSAQQQKLVRRYFSQIAVLAAIAYPSGDRGNRLYERIEGLRSLFDGSCVADKVTVREYDERLLLNMTQAVAVFSKDNEEATEKLGRRNQTRVIQVSTSISETFREFAGSGFKWLSRFAERNLPRPFDGPAKETSNLTSAEAKDPAGQLDATLAVENISIRESAMERTRIFIVHGHDTGTVHETARFLERLRLSPIILHEQPNLGRTLIAKFREEASDVPYAVVIMTADDVGRLRTNPVTDERPRARQNVVFELGFFIGALGPQNVCALIGPDVERPSDFEGIVYIPLDDGKWKTSLAREMRAAAIHFDPANVL